MAAIIRLADEQARIRQVGHRARNVLRSLDLKRTATLRDLLLQPHDAVKRLNVPWFDLCLFGRLMEPACQFLEAAAWDERSRGRADIPFVFFQSSPKEEDETELERRTKGEKDSFIRSHLSRFPWPVYYLHPHTSWFQVLEKQRPTFHRMVMPWSGFNPEHKPGEARMLGYRIPDYPALFGISGRTATAYVTRILAHDLGHSVLPRTPFLAESLHNSVMIQAMEAPEVPKDLSPFESMFLRECTDPAFFLSTHEWMKDCTAADVTLTPLQRAALDCYATAYLDPRMFVPWQLKRGTREEVLAVLVEMKKTHYARYAAFSD